MLLYALLHIYEALHNIILLSAQISKQTSSSFLFYIALYGLALCTLVALEQFNFKPKLKLYYIAEKKIGID